MSVPFGEGDLSSRPPVFELSEGLLAAEAGAMPGLTAEAMLAKLGLDGEVPDGLAIMDRLAGGDRDTATFRSVITLTRQVHDLIFATNTYQANEAQEAWAGLFGAFISTQIRREGDICPGAREIALSSTRDDIISPEIRAMLDSPEESMELPPHIQELLGSLTRQLLSGDLPFGTQDRRGDVFGGAIFVIPLDEFFQLGGPEEEQR